MPKVQRGVAWWEARRVILRRSKRRVPKNQGQQHAPQESDDEEEDATTESEEVDEDSEEGEEKKPAQDRKKGKRSRPPADGSQAAPKSGGGANKEEAEREYPLEFISKPARTLVLLKVQLAGSDSDRRTRSCSDLKATAYRADENKRTLVPECFGFSELLEKVKFSSASELKSKLQHDRYYELCHRNGLEVVELSGRTWNSLPSYEEWENLEDDNCWVHWTEGEPTLEPEDNIFRNLASWVKNEYRESKPGVRVPVSVVSALLDAECKNVHVEMNSEYGRKATYRWVPVDEFRAELRDETDLDKFENALQVAQDAGPTRKRRRIHFVGARGRAHTIRERQGPAPIEPLSQLQPPPERLLAVAT
eukprot:g15214.t1